MYAPLRLDSFSILFVPMNELCRKIKFFFLSSSSFLNIIELFHIHVVDLWKCMWPSYQMSEFLIPPQYDMQIVFTVLRLRREEEGREGGRETNKLLTERNRVLSPGRASLPGLRSLLMASLPPSLLIRPWTTLTYDSLWRRQKGKWYQTLISSESQRKTGRWKTSQRENGGAGPVARVKKWKAGSAAHPRVSNRKPIEHIIYSALFDMTNYGRQAQGVIPVLWQQDICSFCYCHYVFMQMMAAQCR